MWAGMNWRRTFLKPPLLIEKIGKMTLCCEKDYIYSEPYSLEKDVNMRSRKKLLFITLAVGMTLFQMACAPLPNTTTVTAIATRTVTITTTEVTTTIAITRVSSSDKLSLADEAAIYAVIISNYKGLATWCAQTTNPRIYVMNHTDDTAGNNYYAPLNVALIDNEVQLKINDLLSDLSIGWEDGQWPDIGQLAPNGKPCSGAVIVLGNIYQRSDGPMQVICQAVYGNQGATRFTAIIERINGVWQITGTTGPIGIA
jgi:hypothetical protein